jgi:hypothetical protein
MYTRPKPVKAYSLRAVYVGATVITFWALLSAEPAAAHVDVRPDLVEQGEVADLVIELPLITPGPDIVRLEIEGDGIEVLSTRHLPDLPGPESQWSARVRVDAPIGRAPFVLRPIYADGDSVEFRQSFTVVPAEDAGSFPLAGVVVGTAVAVVVAVGGLVLLRRRTS